MESILKPMLADKLTKDGVILWNAIRYPLLATPKLDGIRCLKINGRCVSRKFKPIPNVYVREFIEQYYPDNVDGELMVHGATFSQTSSAIMSRHGQPDFYFCVFDWVRESLKKPYNQRMEDLQTLSELPNISLLLPTLIENEVQLLEYEEHCLDMGYEGVMLRDPYGPYKCGRSTVKQFYLVKLKRFEDSEAEIIGFEEKMHNLNEAKVDELGHIKRSSHKENLVPAGTLGKLIVRDIHHPEWILGIGTGFDAPLAKEIWDNQEEWLHEIIKYSYQLAGMKDLPRFPSFEGKRSKDDM